MTGPGSPPLAWTELERLVAAGDVDTVIVAFTDMQGRLAGKRISGRHFVDDIATRGVECCSYLLAVDVDLNTVPGYAMASWDTGYGDMVMTPDLSTLRLIPWLPGTALVIADLVWADGSEVAVSPRSILRRQLDRLKARGLVADVATELEFIVFDQPYRQAWASGYRGLTPASDYNIDYAILASSRMEPLLRDIRLGMAGAGLRRGGQRRMQHGPAGDRVSLRRGAGHLRQPCDLQERRQGNRRPARQEPNVHGEIR